MTKAREILDTIEAISSSDTLNELIDRFRTSDFDAGKNLKKYFGKKANTFYPGKWIKKREDRKELYELILDQGDKFKIVFRSTTVHKKVGRLRDPGGVKYRVYVTILYYDTKGKPKYPDVEILGASATGESRTSREKVDKGKEKLIKFAKDKLGVSLGVFDFNY